MQFDMDSASAMKYTIFTKRGTKTVVLNRRRAIRYHCMACSNFEWPQVVKCPRIECCLHKFRLGSGKESGLTARDREQAIKQFCLLCINGDQVDVDNCDAYDCALYPYRNDNPFCKTD